MRQMADGWRTCATPVNVIVEDVTTRLWEMYIYAAKADCLDMEFITSIRGIPFRRTQYTGVRRSHTGGLELIGSFGHECEIQKRSDP